MELTTKYYSTKEVSKILGLSLTRIKDATKRGTLKGEKIANRGRYGTYGFTEEAIKEYAKKIGITPVFETGSMSHVETKEDASKDIYSAAFCIIKVGNKYVTGLTPNRIDLTNDLTTALPIVEGAMEYTLSVLEEIGVGELCPLYIRK